MTEKIVLIDFAGTLVKKEIIEEAQQFRSSVLERSLPSDYEHANPDELYKANRDFVSNLTGINSDMLIQYRRNDLERMQLRGEEVQNQIATNLFQIGMYMAAKKHGLNIYPSGFVDELKRIQSLDYRLAIVSGVREDIITGMFAISGLDIRFDYVRGQPPILGVSNEDNSRDILSQVEYVIGDKLSDLEMAPNAHKIFVTWGHASGGEEEVAQYQISKASELQDIIN